MPTSTSVLSRALRRGSRVLPAALLTVSLAAAVAAVAPVSASAAASASTTSTTAKSATRQTGLDVSKWQSYGGASTCATKGIDWRQVASTDRSFVFIKATGTVAGGVNRVDPCFARNHAGAVAAGIYRGAYHYAIPDAKKGSAALQARLFVNTIGSLQDAGDLPPVLDLEADGGLKPPALAAWAKTWLTTVRALTGRQPIIYTGPYFWQTKMADSTAFHAYPLWIAHYTSGSPRVPGGWPTWSVWQHSASGRVAGISTDVDLNVFNGSTAQLRAFAHPATTLTASTSGPYAYRGSTWRVSGNLRTGTTAVTGRTVKLYRQAAGAKAFTEVARTVTSAGSGYFRFDLRPTTAATYKVRYSGGLDVAASWSALRSETVRSRYATKLTSAASKHTTLKGRALHLTGTLTRSTTGARVPGGSVTVYQRVGTGRWTKVSTKRTSAVTASYDFLVRPSRSVTYKVVFAGSFSNLASTSPVRAVRVR